MSFREALDSIVGRLLIWFLTLAIVPAGLLTGIQYWLASSSLARSAEANLWSVARTRAETLDAYSRERLNVATTLTRAPFLIETFGMLAEQARANPVDSDAYRAVIAPLRDRLLGLAEPLGHADLLLVAPDGTVLFHGLDEFDPGANLRQGPMAGTALRAVFDRAQFLFTPAISRFETYLGQNQPLGFLACPVLGFDGRLLGVTLLRLNNQALFDLVEAHEGLGQTGEAVVGALDPGGQSLSLLSHRRHARQSGTIEIPIGGDTARPMQLAVQGRQGAGLDTDYRGEDVLAVWNFVPAFQWGLVVKQDTDEAFALVHKQRTVAAALLGLTLLSVLLLAPWVSVSMARPIQKAAGLADRIARGDLSASISDDARGEPGRLLRALRTMTEDLRRLIGRIQQSSVQVLGTANQIAGAVRREKETVQHYGSATSQAAAAVAEISGTSKSLAETMREVNQLAARTGCMAGEGLQGLRHLSGIMTQLAGSTGTILDGLNEISQRAGAINLVITTVTKLADQTDLLSINAAIEAEKAGEAARGFVVVAREIRRLSDQTAAATLEIEDIVRELQDSASRGVKQVERYGRQVEHSASEVHGLTESLDHIIRAVGDLTPRFDQVTEGMHAQAVGADQIREAMDELRAGALATAESLADFEAASRHLQDSVASLRADVERFRLTPPPESA